MLYPHHPYHSPTQENKTMKKHWIFHKYKWTTDSILPLYYSGLFSDGFGEVRFQTGNCECGAWKMRQINVSPEELRWEQVKPLMRYQLDVANRLSKEGRYKAATEVLKIRF